MDDRFALRKIVRVAVALVAYPILAHAQRDGDTATVGRPQRSFLCDGH